MRTLVAAMLCVGCFSKPGAPVGALDDAGIADAAVDARILTGGTRRVITVTVPPTESLTRFPLAVLIQSDVDLGQAATDAKQVAFATITSEALDCEIVEYVSGAGYLEAWVTIPVLPTVPYQFQLVYGTAIESPCTVTHQQVWGEYAGAWHLGDKLLNTSVDSSINKLDLGTTRGLGTATSAVMGAGLIFDPNDASGVDVMCTPTKPALAFDDRSFSYEIWVHPLTLLGMYDVALTKGGQTEGRAGFDIELGLEQWNAWIRDGRTGPDDNYQDFATFTDQSQFYTDTWSHLAVVVDRAEGQLRVYLNGVLVDSDTDLMTGSVTASSDLCVGDDTARSHAIFDEPRVHSVARTAAWIKTTYQNLMEPGFLVLDPNTSM